MVQADHLNQSLLSIDRLVLLFKSPFLSLWAGSGMSNYSRCQVFKNLLEKAFGDDIMGFSSPTELYEYHFKHSAGYDIQFGPRYPKLTKHPSDVELSLAFGVSASGKFIVPQEYGLRIEFNPNTVTHPFSVLSPLFKISDFTLNQGVSDVRVSRIDIAIDYPENINPALILCSRSQKSFTVVGSSGIESIYFGSRSSASYFRIYNKALEISQKTGDPLTSPLWRIELESKSGFSLSETPDFFDVFSRLHFYHFPVSTGDWLIDVVLESAYNHGLKQVLNRMPDTTRKRWKKILESYEFTSIDHPSEVYSRSFVPCFNSLRSSIMYGLGYNLLDDSLRGCSNGIREY